MKEIQRKSILVRVSARFHLVSANSIAPIAHIVSMIMLHPGGEGGGYSGFQVTGMIEWGQKSKLKKIRRASNNTKKKIPGPNNI